MLYSKMEYDCDWTNCRKYRDEYTKFKTFQVRMSLFDDEFVALHFFGGSPYLPSVCCSGSGRVGRFLQISDNEVRTAGKCKHGRL